jgi:hypothetical protein
MMRFVHSFGLPPTRAIEPQVSMRTTPILLVACLSSAAGCGDDRKSCEAVARVVKDECAAFELLQRGATTMSDSEFEHARTALEAGVQALATLDVPAGESNSARFTREQQEGAMAMGTRLSASYVELRKARQANPEAREHLSDQDEAMRAMLPICSRNASVRCDSF